MNEFLTIITPTFNRKELLSQLKISLDNQCNFNFIWRIIDDGSTDETEKLCADWLNNKKYKIEYYKCSNGGKHKAINFGIKGINTLLTVIIDSDDVCKPNFILEILQAYSIYSKNKIIGCYSFLCENKHGEILPTKFPYTGIIDRHYNLTYRHNIHGDKVDVFYTKILQKYPFPEFPNEKFITEELLWNRIAKEYKKVGINSSILVHDYYPDGLTRQYENLLRKNKKGATLYFKERAKLKISLIMRLRSIYSIIKLNFYK